jgi:signal transduction histidine kinase
VCRGQARLREVGSRSRWMQSPIRNALRRLTLVGLSIETTNVRLDAAYASGQDDVAPGDYVVVAVSDTGSGMSADVVAKAVDPFFTTKPIGEGTGLGLSMIYGFAKQTRGNLRIYSEIGHGTTVKLYLPRALQDAVVLEKPRRNRPVGREKRSLSWKTMPRCG